MTAVLVLLFPLLVACAASSPQATSLDLDAPLPTIGLSSDLSGSGGVSEAGAEASDIDAVVMIGDSITKGSEPLLADAFDLLGLDDVIEAENGKRIASSSSGNPSGVLVAASLAESGDGNPADEVWVVALGTNDIGQYDSEDEIAEVIDELLDQVPDEAALVWVDTWIVLRAEESAEVNSAIRERVARRGNGVVAAWTDVAGDDGVLSTDGIHPTTAGAEVFASVVADAVRTVVDR